MSTLIAIKIGNYIQSTNGINFKVLKSFILKHQNKGKPMKGIGHNHQIAYQPNININFFFFTTFTEFLF